MLEPYNSNLPSLDLNQNVLGHCTSFCQDVRPWSTKKNVSPCSTYTFPLFKDRREACTFEVLLRETSTISLQPRNFFFCFSVLGTEPRASGMLEKCAVTEPYHQLFVNCVLEQGPTKFPTLASDLPPSCLRLLSS